MHSFYTRIGPRCPEQSSSVLLAKLSRRYQVPFLFQGKGAHTLPTAAPDDPEKPLLVDRCG